MKRSASPVLIALNLLLAGVLLYLWVDTQGRLRNIHWTPPAPRKPDLTGMLPVTSRTTDHEQMMLVMLDRPLFSPSRRPPPPVQVVVPPPPDPLANVQLFGTFGSGDVGGIIVRVEGKMRRANLKDKIGEWTIQTIDGRDVTFVRGSETRIIRLAPVRPAPGTTGPRPPVR